MWHRPGLRSTAMLYPSSTTPQQANTDDCFLHAVLNLNRLARKAALAPLPAGARWKVVAALLGHASKVLGPEQMRAKQVIELDLD